MVNRKTAKNSRSRIR